MTRAAKVRWLKASLATWRRKHAYRQRKANIAHQKNDVKGVNKWSTEMRRAGVEIRRRQRQIHALTAKPKPKSKPSLRARAVANAASHIGTYETCYNGNYGSIERWQRRFGFGRVAWCGIFCGNMLLSVGIRPSSLIASVAEIERLARNRQDVFRGWTENEKSALPGDLVVLGGHGRHVGMVESVNADRSINTIEGNCGNAVRRMRRSRAVVYGIAQVNFPG